jgi:DDE superfamily endonuclease
LLWTERDDVVRRVVDGRPVSHVTTACLAWVWERRTRERQQVLGLIWENASWHLSREVRRWKRAHHQKVKQHGAIRLLTGRLPVKSPWLNPLEPQWGHGKHAIVEPARLLTAAQVMSRVCDYFEAEH